jgi:peptidoglycan/xylan/chitin deacetylase (PgdA/CDA1 family)
MPQTFTEHYAVLKQLQKPSIRDVSRKMALDTLSSIYAITGTTDAALKKPRVQFLYIHHIFKDEEVLLKKLIEKLSAAHTFVSYNEAVTRILTGTVDKPYISISSDDGLKNNLHAAKILADYGISACFFICPPMIGENDYQKIKKFSEQRLHLPPVEFMNWKDVETLLQQGHEIGAHTMSHVNLATCNASELEYEIVDCFEEIKKACGSSRHFAYPYGRYHHFTAAAKNMVFSNGFYSCASAERGCHLSPQGTTIEKEHLFIRRDHVILSWPLDHILFFMARSAQKADIHNNDFTYHADSHTNKQ